MKTVVSLFAYFELVQKFFWEKMSFSKLFDKFHCIFNLIKICKTLSINLLKIEIIYQFFFSLSLYFILEKEMRIAMIMADNQCKKDFRPIFF